MAGKPDKLTRMRELLDEFENPADAFVLMRDLHHEKVQKKHMESVATFGRVVIDDWAAMQSFMEEPPSPGTPLHELLGVASAEIQAAVATKDDAKLFGLLFLIAKAIKPHNLYARRDE